MKPIEWFLYVSQSPLLYCLVDLPSIMRSPEVYLSSPPIMFKSVVLPQPDSPTIPIVLPRSRLKDTPSTARKNAFGLPNILLAIGKYCFRLFTRKIIILFAVHC